ncbi:MAG: histidinol-phosphate transaminase [Formosimonas sp.]
MSVINTRIRPEIRAMAAYHVPDASGFIKLDAMENPYVLPDDLKAQLAQRLADVALNRYPVPSYAALVRRLRDYAQIPDAFGVMLGNGSDELIHLLSMAVSKPAEKVTILAPAPSFVMYRMSALLNHVDYVEVDLRQTERDFQLDVPAMCAAIALHRPALVYLPFPNNPTGCEFARADMLAVIEAARQVGALAVVDEAYQPFAEHTWMSELAQFDNLLVMRTVSKLGLAGVRLGYMAGRADLMGELNKVRPPYNINVLTEAAVDFVLEHAHVLESQAAQIRATRSTLLAALRDVPQVRVFDSHANFVLVQFPDGDAAFAHLKASGILVKSLSAAHPLLRNCLRLTVGTEDENQKMLAAIATLVA